MLELSLRMTRDYPSELGLKMPFKEKKTVGSKGWHFFSSDTLFWGDNCYFWLSKSY